MIRDMLDIAYLRYSKSSQTIVICKDAEDPSLTDGLLIGRTTSNCISFNENASGVGDSNTWESRRIAGKNVECSYSKTSTKKIEYISSTRMPPDSFSNGLLPDRSDDDEGTNSGCDEFSVDEKSESSIFGGDYPE